MNFKAVNVSPMEKVFPTAAPSEEGAREKLSGLRGEIVSFQLAYYAESQGFARAEAEVVSPIRANVKLRKVALVPCEYPCGPIVDEDYLTTAPGLYPDRLEVLDPPTGETAVGDEGYMEFHVDEAALRQTVIDLFYEPRQAS